VFGSPKAPGPLEALLRDFAGFFLAKFDVVNASWYSAWEPHPGTRLFVANLSCSMVSPAQHAQAPEPVLLCNTRFIVPAVALSPLSSTLRIEGTDPRSAKHSPKSEFT